MIAAAFIELIAIMSKRQATRLLGVSRSSHYRKLQLPVFGPPTPRPTPANKLSDAERDRVLAVLRSGCDYPRRPGSTTPAEKP